MEYSVSAGVRDTGETLVMTDSFGDLRGVFGDILKFHIEAGGFAAYI